MNDESLVSPNDISVFNEWFPEQSDDQKNKIRPKNKGAGMYTFPVLPELGMISSC